MPQGSGACRKEAGSIMNTSAIQGGTGRVTNAEPVAPRRTAGGPEVNPSVAQTQIEPTPKQIRAAVESLQEIAASMDIKLNFQLSQTNDEVVVKVLNRETNEVIREIPPENIRRLADRMAELNGLLFDSRA
jgi:flagellar protein FlaG